LSPCREEGLVELEEFRPPEREQALDVSQDSEGEERGESGSGVGE